MPTFFERSPIAEGERPARRRWSNLLRLAGIFLFWWLLTAAVYRETASSFLRAESGWFLLLSHSAPAVQKDFEKGVLIKNLHGHYAPFAFLAEFEMAKLAGTSGAFWKWRQITVLALLAAALFEFARASAAALGLLPTQAFFSAAALTSVLVFQVQMREFIAWPFMIMQLFWLLFTMLALLSLVRMTQSPTQRKWPWLAAAASYLSLHFFGLGIATGAATAAAMTGIWLARRRGGASTNAKIATPLLSLFALTALHAVAMQRFMRAAAAPAPSLPGWDPREFLTECLGYIPNLVFSALRSLFSTTHSRLGAGELSQDWPYGVAILLGIGLLLSAAFFRAVKKPGARNEIRLLLHSFALALFLAMIALVSVREWLEPTSSGFADYLNASRYRIPASFALVGILTEMFLLIAWLPVVPGVILNMGVGLCAVVAHLHFAAHIYLKDAPRAGISHDRAWRSIVTMARECQSAGLAIPNVPLGQLTQEFSDWELKLFEPLLRADMELPPETKLDLVPWSDVANAVPDNYSRHVPSLAQVKKRLLLDAQAR